ncbi:hypothetical protein MNBD_CHLOROFLEXI01-3770, partial [hydrothermal vent metagenome]
MRCGNVAKDVAKSLILAVTGNHPHLVAVLALGLVWEAKVGLVQTAVVQASTHSAYSKRAVAHLPTHALGHCPLHPQNG